MVQAHVHVRAPGWQQPGKICSEPSAAPPWQGTSRFTYMCTCFTLCGLAVQITPQKGMRRNVKETMKCSALHEWNETYVHCSAWHSALEQRALMLTCHSSSCHSRSCTANCWVPLHEASRSRHMRHDSHASAVLTRYHDIVCTHQTRYAD